MPVNIDKVNAAYAKITWNRIQSEPQSSPIALLNSSFMFYADNFLYDPRYKDGVWDGKIRLFKTSTGLLPSGLVPKAATILKTAGFAVNIGSTMHDMFKSDITDDDIKRFISRITTDMHGIIPYDHQKKILNYAMKRKRVLLESPTGSGKSLGIYMAIRMFLDKFRDNNTYVLIVVPSKQLVEQMFKDFKDYKWKAATRLVGRVYGETDDTQSDYKVVVSTYQSINSMIERGDKMWLSRFNMVIVDEAHQAKSLSIQNILTAMPNAEYRIGLTGTVPLSDMASHTIMGSIGPKIVVTTIRELINLGVLTDLEVVHIPISYTPGAASIIRHVNFETECKATEKCGSREKIIESIIDSGEIKEGQNTLILVNRIKSLDSLSGWLSKKYSSRFNIMTISGSLANKAREKIRADIEKSTNVILVATYGTMSTGINIKKLHNVVLASSSKSYTRVIQSVGRGLRLHSTKDKVKIFDIHDNIIDKGKSKWMSFTCKHWYERLKFYEMQDFNIRDYTIDDVFDISEDDLID